MLSELTLRGNRRLVLPGDWKYEANCTLGFEAMAILRAARGSHFVVHNSTILHGSHYQMLARTSL